jgi:hypothetical protein
MVRLLWALQKAAVNKSPDFIKDLAEKQTARLLAEDASLMLPMDRFWPWDGGT